MEAQGEQALTKRVDVIRETIRGLHQGQQPCGAAPTGRTHGCTRPVLINAQKPLAPRGPSTHAPLECGRLLVGSVAKGSDETEAKQDQRRTDHFDLEGAGKGHGDGGGLPPLWPPAGRMPQRDPVHLAA